MTRVLASGLTKGLIFFSIWATFRFSFLWLVSVDGPQAGKPLTDVEFYSLELRPSIDLYLLFSLAILASTIAGVALLLKRQRDSSYSWLLAGLSCLIAGFGTIFLPVLTMSGRLPGPFYMTGNYHHLAWSFLKTLGMAWLLLISILWAVVARHQITVRGVE